MAARVQPPNEKLQLLDLALSRDRENEGLGLPGLTCGMDAVSPQNWIPEGLLLHAAGLIFKGLIPGTISRYFQGFG